MLSTVPLNDVADSGALNTSSGSQACAANGASSAADDALKAQVPGREGARASRVDGGGDGNRRSDATVRVGDVGVDPVDVFPLTSSPRLTAEWRTGSGCRGTSAREADISPLRDNEVFSAEHVAEEFSDRLVTEAAPVDTLLLTSVEEQQPRDSMPDIPAVVVLRHRMGSSMVVLKPHQRKSYSRHDLESFILYKEQKYNAVNVLWRFSILLLLVFSFSVFCLVLSTFTTEWLSVQSNNSFLSVGLFFSCRNPPLHTCTSWQSSRLEWTVVDPVTGATLCHASAGFVRRFSGALWTMGTLQLLCEVAALVLSLWITARPTRSGALVLLIFDFLLSVCSGIVALILFNSYTSCLRRTCDGERVPGGACDVRYRYGYRLHIGSVAVHGLLLVLALCMHSYIHNIRVTSRDHLLTERRRLSHRAQAGESIVRMLDSPTTAGVAGDNGGDSCARSTPDAIQTTLPLDEHQPMGQPSAAAAGPSGAIVTVSDRAVAAPSNNRGRTDQGGCEGGGASGNAAHHNSDHGRNSATATTLAKSARDSPSVQDSELHVFFADVPGGADNDEGSALLRESRSRRHLQHQSVSTLPFGDGRARAPAAETTAASNASGHSTDSSFVTRERSVGTAAADDSGNDQRQCRDRQRTSPENSLLLHTGHQYSAGPQMATAQPSLTSKRQKQSLPHKLRATPVYRQSRKHQNMFLRFFNRKHDSNYLTAAELGVPIAGATDWVYDDRSDMFYSFDQNMFWDPLTQEYYNCALRSWQESPDQIVGVHDI
nr:unnamed protein product [Leishmania braziliensis]